MIMGRASPKRKQARRAAIRVQKKQYSREIYSISRHFSFLG